MLVCVDRTETRRGRNARSTAAEPRHICTARRRLSRFGSQYICATRLRGRYGDRHRPAHRQGRRVAASRRATTRAADTATLAQITPANAKNLHVSWTFSTGVLRGHEGQPLVVGNTMYIITPYPNVAYAHRSHAAGLSAQVEVPAGERAGGGGHRLLRRRESRRVVRRRQDRLQSARRTHRRRGRRHRHRAVATKMGDINRGETITMAPIVVKGKVIVGSSGGEMGVRGWIAALDLGTGKQLWRAYNVGPDSDIKVGPRFKPFYAAGPRRERCGGSSWPGDIVEGGRRHGVGMDLVRPRSSTSSITARPTPARGTASSAPATTSGARRSSRATPTPARWCGPFSRRRTTSGTTTRSMRIFSSTCRSTARRARRSCTSTATASPTRWIAQPARCCSPSRSCR